MKGFAGTLALVASLSHRAAAQPTVDLIGQIAEQLGTIMTNAKNEQKNNDAAFAKVQCDCDEQIKNAEENIPVLEKEIAEGMALIETLRADSSEKSIKVNSLREKNAADEDLIVERQGKRDEDFNTWKTNNDNWQGSITQLKGAIKVLEDGTATAFLQEHSSQGRQLIEAVSMVANAASHTAQLVSLLQSETTAKNSGQVLGVLNKMLQMFEENKADALAAETKSKRMHEAWKKRTRDEISAANKLIGELQSVMSDNTTTITSTQGEVKTAKTSLAEKEKQLADFTKKLEEYTAEHTKLTKESLELQEGLQKAITFLNSEDAREKLAALVPSFVQLRSSHGQHSKHSFLAVSPEQESTSSTNKPASSLLATAFALQKSGIAATAGAEVGVWTTVLQSIADLEKAQQENVARAHAKAKDCDSQMEVHFNVWKGLVVDETDLKSKEQSLTLALTGAKDSITTATDTIATKSAAIEQLEAETRESQAEYREYAANAEAATPILKKTIEILEEPAQGVTPTKTEFSGTAQNDGTVAAVNAIKNVLKEMKSHVGKLKEDYETMNATNAGLIQEADAAIKTAKKELAEATGEKGENAGNLALCKTNLVQNANSQLAEQLWWGETGTNDKWGTGYTCATYMGRIDLQNAGDRTGDWIASPTAETPGSGTGPYYADVQTAKEEIAELGKVKDIISNLQSGLEG